MTGELESALRQMLKSVVREVANEMLHDPCFSKSPNRSQQPGDEDRFLLRASEAAERLAISQRHLHKLTVDGVLPCVRVGRLVHYSIETIEQWIRESETTDPPEPRPKVTVKNQKANPDRPTRITKSKKASKRVQARVSQGKPTEKPKKKPATACHPSDPEPEEERSNPFKLLLKEIGIDRNDLGPLTNGELRKIADVDLSTFHGWMYQGRELPEEALDKLRSHFSQLVSNSNRG